MSPRSAFVMAIAACVVASVACSDDGDDDCPDCRPSMGGSVTFPPSVPTVGRPDPMGGSPSQGGQGTGGPSTGGVITGGIGGVVIGGTGGVSPDGGVSGTAAFGNQGGDLAGGAFTGGTVTGGFGGTL